MPNAPVRQHDPIRWCAAIALMFLALAGWHLGIPSKIYFDETHYVAAARKLIELLPANNEHPLVGKEIIAASIMLLGDRPLAWRLPALLFGAAGLFAFGRIIWWASGRRFATLAGMVLLATGFAWFIQSRIAMLDIYAATFAMVAGWLLARAVHLPLPGARIRIAVAGVCIGLAIGSKWTVAPLAVLPGLTFLVMKLWRHHTRFLTARSGGPVPGMRLIEAALWLGIVPLAVYWLTYLPAFFYRSSPVGMFDVIGHHRHMIALQDSVVKHHQYQSVWYQWVVNWRAIWYLYEPVDGAQRGILLIGNPFTMLAGLPAVIWAVWAGIARRRMDALAFAAAYATSLGMWVVSGKPVQFYYHYMLPATFMIGCLALALDDLWRKGPRWRWAVAGVIAIAIGMFAWFYPIISAAPLHEGRISYQRWMWLDSWR